MKKKSKFKAHQFDNFGFLKRLKFKKITIFKLFQLKNKITKSKSTKIFQIWTLKIFGGLKFLLQIWKYIYIYSLLIKIFRQDLQFVKITKIIS